MRPFRLIVAFGILALIVAAAASVLGSDELMRIGRPSEDAAASEPRRSGETFGPADMDGLIAARVKARRGFEGRDASANGLSAGPLLSARWIDHDASVVPRPIPQKAAPGVFVDAEEETAWYEGELIVARARVGRLVALRELMDERGDARPSARARIDVEIGLAQAREDELQRNVDALHAEQSPARENSRVDPDSTRQN